MNWLDWVLVAIIAWGAAAGFLRGAALLLADLAGAASGLYVAARFTSPLLAWLDARFGVLAATARLIGERIALVAPAAPGSPPTGAIQQALRFSGVPPGFADLLGAGARATALGGLGADGRAAALGGLGHQLALLLWSVALFAAAGWLAAALLRIAAAALTGLLGPAGLLNRFAGAALGAARNALWLGALGGVALPLLAGRAAWPALAGSRLLPALGAWTARILAWALGEWL